MNFTDSLSHVRNQFHIPAGKIYFCGHSLGLQPKTAEASVLTELESWREIAIRGFTQGKNAWAKYVEPLRETLAPWVGASASEIGFMNTLTTNLHILLEDFYQPTSERFKIMIEDRAFPSDQYALASHLRLHGFDPESALIRVKPQQGTYAITEEDWTRAFQQHGNSIALVLIGHPNYLTGQAFPIPFLQQRAKECGAIFALDLAHGVGNLELSLHDWQVDFAVWCNYKYLNGGPGAVGGYFVHEKHAHRSRSHRLEGWWGNRAETRFEMRDTIDADSGANGRQISTPNILSLASLRAGLDIFSKLDPKAYFKRRLQLTSHLEKGLLALQSKAFSIITPSDPSQRGAALTLFFHSDAVPVEAKLSAAGVLCDFRRPNMIRVAPSPLYTSFEEVDRFCEILKSCI